MKQSSSTSPNSWKVWSPFFRLTVLVLPTQAFKIHPSQQTRNEHADVWCGPVCARMLPVASPTSLSFSRSLSLSFFLSICLSTNHPSPISLFLQRHQIWICFLLELPLLFLSFSVASRREKNWRGHLAGGKNFVPLVAPDIAANVLTFSPRAQQYCCSGYKYPDIAANVLLQNTQATIWTRGPWVV